MKKLFLLLLITLVVFSLISCMETNKADIVNQNLFRLHVIANSDSAEDQSVKLKVRNSVIEYLENKDENIDDMNTFKEMVINNQNEILETVKNTLNEYGKDYGAALSIGVYDFPEKEYYGTIVPAGEYEALRVILGKGEGKNWWCVLFPPLCFVDVEYEEIEGQTMEIEDIEDIQVRSKLLEWLEKIKQN